MRKQARPPNPNALNPIPVSLASYCQAEGIPVGAILLNDLPSLRLSLPQPWKFITYNYFPNPDLSTFK